jgi:hypothetical protein
MRIRFHENVRFCPHCGVDAIERDFYRQASPQPGGGGEKGVRQIPDGTEWICRICGFGFRITKSARHGTAENLLSRDRSLRNSVTFDTECVGAEVATAYVAARNNKEF